MEGPLFQMFLLFSLLFLCLTCSIKGEDVDPNQAEPASDPFDSLFNRYHTQSDLNDFLDVIVATCPNITRKYSIGKSAGGEDLWAIQMSDNPDVNEAGEVELQYIANMHGDEVVGRELSLYLIHYLCTNYNSEERVRNIIDNMDIHILPTMNPDGFRLARRSNLNGFDLNRNFPDQFSQGLWHGSFPLPPLSHGDGHFIAPSGNFQPEVRAVMKWMGDHNFALAANFHGGSVVANYPFDGNANHRSGVYAPSPDDTLFRQVAQAYASKNGPMANSREFLGGITNGAKWYVLYGGMQDYAYLWHGSIHITVELSNNKWPPPNELTSYWQDNLESMISYTERAIHRVWGVVTDCATKEPITVGVVIPALASCAPTCNTQASKIDGLTGDYHRLLPSVATQTTYLLTVAAPGYTSRSGEIVVGPGIPMPLRQDFCLDKTS